MPFKLSSQVCAAHLESREYYSVSTCMTELFKVKVYSLHVEVSKAEYVQQFLFTATCSFACVHSRYGTVNSHLMQIFTCATVNVKTMFLDFFICI